MKYLPAYLNPKWAYTLTLLAVAVYLTHERPDTCDFYNFYWAAKGITTSFWWYKDYCRVLWMPYALFPYWAGFILWDATLLGCYLRLSRRVMLKPFGWMLVIATIKPLIWILKCGGSAGMLALWVIHPWGIVLAGAVKPYLLAFMVFPLFNEFRRLRNSTRFLQR